MARRAKTNAGWTLLFLASLLALGAGGSRRTPPLPEQPNIILIVTDDQRWDSLWAMPELRARLVELAFFSKTPRYVAFGLEHIIGNAL